MVTLPLLVERQRLEYVVKEALEFYLKWKCYGLAKVVVKSVPKDTLKSENGTKHVMNVI